MSAAPTRRVLAGLVALLALGAAMPALAQAGDVVVKVEALDKAGNPESRAGIAPDRFITRLTPSPGTAAKNFEFGFPAGMGGNARAVPRCSRGLFEADYGTECPPESQVGLMKTITEGEVSNKVPIYNLAAAPGQVAAFGEKTFLAPGKFGAYLRSSDLGLTMRTENLSRETPGGGRLDEVILEFWGVPADHLTGTSTPRRALLTNPTRCDRGPMAISVSATSWENPGVTDVFTANTGVPLGGCGALPFSSSLDFEMENPTTEAPTGFDVDVKFPEASGPDVPAVSQAKSVVLEFPVGMGFSPAAAAGLGACTDAQFAFGSETPAACPRSARIGTVEVGAPQFSNPIKGTVYLGSERPGQRFRLFAVASDVNSGVELKLTGSMRIDPVSGRVIATLPDLPEFSFGHLRMHFDGGPKALFLAPSGCGPATLNSTITPYSGGAPSATAASVEIGPKPGRRCGAPRSFNPAFGAVLSAQRGGQPTSFSTLIERRDDEQSIDRFNLALPQGLGAHLNAVTTCSDAGVAATTCPASSRVGSAAVGVGTGSGLAQLKGDAYLTGPSGNAPFGIAMLLHAALGPFDFGTITVRSKFKLDPLTGRATIESGSLPQTIEGASINFRSIYLDIDQPGFLQAPTSCGSLPVGATLSSTEGAVAKSTAHLSLRDCIALPFRPSFEMALTGRGELHRGGEPGLRFSMRAKAGEANLRSSSIVLPSVLKLDPGSVKEICPRRRAQLLNCPKASRVGSGFARTRLLDKPLKGGTYLVQPEKNGEPDIWTILKGEGVEIALRSISSHHKGHVQTQFEELPDMSLSSFSVELEDHRVLVMRRSICDKGGSRDLRAPTILEGQNSALRQLQVPVSTSASGC